MKFKVVKVNIEILKNSFEHKLTEKFTYKNRKL